MDRVNDYIDEEIYGIMYGCRFCNVEEGDHSGCLGRDKKEFKRLSEYVQKIIIF